MRRAPCCWTPSGRWWSSSHRPRGCGRRSARPASRWTRSGAAAGFGAEIAYYLEHHLEGADEASLGDLRDRCAEALRAASAASGLDHATAREAMLASLEFRLFPDVSGALEELRGAGCRLVVVSNWDCSLPDWLAPTGVLDLLDGVVSSAEVGAAKPDSAPFRRGLELAGAEAAAALHVGDSAVNDVEGAGAAGVRAVLLARDGRPPADVESVASLARGRLPTLNADGSRGRRLPTRPAGAPGGRSAAMAAVVRGVGFLVALTATLVAVGIVAAVLGVNTDEEDATFTALATLAQSAIFIGTAVTFASFTRKPKAWHFGLRRTPLWRAVGWAALGLFVFYLTAAIYSVIVQPEPSRPWPRTWAADEGTFGLIAAGFLIICVAPAAEEFFFRGFFFRALRSRYSVLAAAAIDGGLFGMIHYDFSGADALLILPLLALLGFIFCLVYEKTGSIFPVIAMHSFNNAIAFGARPTGGRSPCVLGPLMLLAVLTAAHFVPAAPALRGTVARPLRAAGVP